MAKKEETGYSLQALKAAIKENQLSGLYIFHGEETFLQQHYLSQMKKQLIEDLTESFNFHKLTVETFDVQTFADAVENLPMMAEHTMVWVDEIDLFKLPEADRNKLAEVFSDIPEYCTVIFTYETTPWKPDKRLKKFWEAVNANAKIVEFPKQEQRDLIPWVARHFASQKKNISSELCAYLIEITGGTMTALAGEIAKISAYSGADTIVRSDINAVTEPVLDAVAFRMTDYLTQGQYGPALLELRRLMKMQEEPIRVLGAIGKQFRSLGVARTLEDHGRPASELSQLQGISEYAAKKTMQTARKLSAAFCARILELIMDTDRAMKTSLDDNERLLEVLIFRISQEARYG